MKINEINILCCRGIPELELEINGKNLIIKGENGTGKSSIVDAFEFLLTGKISHLEGPQTLSLKRHAPHVNYSKESIRIEITFEDNTHLIRTFQEEPTLPPHLKLYLEEAKKGTFILRRAQLLEFIISKPAERFRAIGAIIGIDFLDNIELNIKRARDELKGEFDSKLKIKNRIFEDISSLFDKKITEINQILPNINLKLQEKALEKLKNLENLENYSKELFKKIKLKAGKSEEIENFQNILRLVDKCYLREEDILSIDELNRNIEIIIDNENKRKLSFLELYTIGIDLLKNESIDLCPLCEQPIDRPNLTVNIDNRLQELRNLSDQASEVRSSLIPISKTIENLIKNLDILNENIKNISDLGNEKSNLAHILIGLKNFETQINSVKDLESKIDKDKILLIKNTIEDNLKRIENQAEKLLEEIELSEEEKAILEIYDLLTALNLKYFELVKIQGEEVLAEIDFKNANLIYSSYSQIKKEKIQEIYDLIQSDVRRFYQAIHPDDPHQNITLEVSSGKRASTELKIDSFGKVGEDPRAFTSEGHLDSLGLCVFLAFVKKFNVNCSLIILDDIITTIDSQHRKKIADLLLTEFIQNQLIITTHDGIWYEQLRAAQRVFRIENRFINIEIIGWNKDRGLTIRNFIPRWEKIEERISNADKTGAGNDGRSYLEGLLKKLCQLMKVQIEYKEDGRYSLAELLDPTEKRLLRKARGDFKRKVEAAFANLRMQTLLANILSHDNLLIELVSMQEVTEFCNSIHELHELFLCPICKRFLKYSQEAHRIKCSNESCTEPFCYESV